MNNKIINNNANIASIAVAVPPYSFDQNQAKKFFISNYSGILNSKNSKILDKMFSHSSILKRRLAIENLQELINETADEKIERFTRWSIKLSAEACTKALDEAGVNKDDVSDIVVNTCTGYLCPGISTYLIEKLGLKSNIKAYDLVGSGCAGALPNLELCKNILNGSDNRVVLSVAVEICTATYQMENDLSLILSNALFSDGASAAVVMRCKNGLSLLNSSSFYESAYREDIRYIYKNGQLHNKLSTRLPGLVGKAVGEVVKALLDSYNLKNHDIKHWALHSGGHKVINAVRDELDLTESQVEIARKILAEYGNMSSASVWFSLNKILKEKINPGEFCVMISFGAGFSAHALLLRA